MCYRKTRFLLVGIKDMGLGVLLISPVQADEETGEGQELIQACQHFFQLAEMVDKTNIRKRVMLK